MRDELTHDHAQVCQCLGLTDTVRCNPPDNPTPEDILLEKDRAATLARMLDTLSPREARAIRLRYGIGCEEHTLDQVGEQYGVSRERIRQIEAKAFRRLKHPARVKQLDNVCFGRWRSKAHCNLYVPHYRRAEAAAQEAQRAADTKARERERAHELREQAEAIAQEQASRLRERIWRERARFDALREAANSRSERDLREAARAQALAYEALARQENTTTYRNYVETLRALCYPHYKAHISEGQHG